ncbi:MAG: hypothetical protein H6517_03340 [Microthrixaceae bacterium]|nr:hypothetical protein [Microthrixaceae bacterium]MCB9386842.1 hypothetical protein [Microthrixaceae bacterium]MCO5321224.1 hypothetical protein [Microthrixaceae bacterium]
MAKGKWAQGITPRHFDWVIKDQLAICERPGGFGENHRKVRRQEEIIWIREQSFDRVISISPAPHNLHNYDEMGVRWLHWPYPGTDEIGRYLTESYTNLAVMLGEHRKLLLHGDEISERLLGFLAGYLVFTGMVPESPKAISLIENITSRQLGADGRRVVSEALKVTPER